MSDLHKSTRIGDLLVERGTITRQQLAMAIEAQQKRRLQDLQNTQDLRTGKIDSAKADPAKTGLGEILIELGYINRRQLDSGLSWQQKLRKTTLVMAFVAPLLTAACGGGGGGSGASNNSTQQAGASSSQQMEQSANTDKPLSSSKSSANSSFANSTASSKSSSSQQSSAPVSVTPSTSSSAKSSSSSSTPASTEVGGPVAIYWSVPTFRENGAYLDITEIGGYELRYKLKSANAFEYVKIDSGYTDTYYFDHLEGEYEFEIATYDVNKLYSDFVPIRPL